MDMKDWAKREIEIACKRERGNALEGEWDYGCACYESAYKAFLSLLDDEHSGYSIGVTKQILNRLIDGKPLIPIEDTPDVWMNVTREKQESYQCKRMSSLFKDVYPDGTITFHDINRVRCIYSNNPDIYWNNGFISNIIEEMFPITMPYMPESKPYVAYCDELLTDRKNGDYDTIAIRYVQKPDGEKVDIYRYFKEDENGSSFIEIDETEYSEREEMNAARKHRERQMAEG